MSTGTTDTSSVELESIADQMKTMHQVFFGSVGEGALGYRADANTSTYFNPTSITSLSNASTLSNIVNVFKNHDEADAFYNGVVGVTVTSDNSTVSIASNVNVKIGGTSTYTPVPFANWGTGMRDKLSSTAGSEKLVDINVTNLVTSGSELEKLLNALYMWHELCDDTTWNNYMQSPSTNVSLKKATLSSGINELSSGVNKNANVTTANTDKNNMNRLLAFSTMEGATTIERFMVRRLLYVYIRALQFHIAMRFVKNVHGANTADGVLKNKAWALPATIIGLLERDIADVNKIIRKVEDITLRSKNEYQTLNNGIGTLHDTIDKQKTYIRNQMDRASSETKYEKRGKSLTIASLVILVLVIVGAIAVSVLPLDRPRRMVGAAAVLGVASLGALILTVVFSKAVVEGFAGSAFTDSVGADKLVNDITFNNGNKLFSSEMRRLVLEYMQQCSQLVSAVKSYQILGNVNYTMTKESRFFGDLDKQMNVAGEKIKNTHRSSDLVQKQNSASMYLFISLSVIIGASLLSLTAFENMPILRTITYAVAGFLTVLAIVIYVLEHSSYVRTDGDKKYWSQPPNTGMMITP